MPIFLLSLFLLVSLFLEATLIQLPLTLIVLLLFLIRLGRSWILIFALFAGVVLDILLLRPIGETSIFFLLFLFLVLLYEQKYERKTSIFTGLTAGIGSGISFLLFGSSSLFLQIGISVIFAVALFFISGRIEVWKKEKR